MPVHNPKPEEGLLIVNLGKNMDFWTGGRFKATLHRVVNKSGTVRHSVPFFYEPNMDAIIKENIDFTPMTTVYFLGLKSTSFKRASNSYFLSRVMLRGFSRTKQVKKTRNMTLKIPISSVEWYFFKEYSH